MAVSGFHEMVLPRLLRASVYCATAKQRDYEIVNFRNRGPHKALLFVLISVIPWTDGELTQLMRFLKDAFKRPLNEILSRNHKRVNVGK